MDGSEPPMNEAQDYALRFEDLTVDDDLPLTDRIVRYCRSGIALQRLVHVKMLAETAETVGYVFGTMALICRLRIAQHGELLYFHQCHSHTASPTLWQKQQYQGDLGNIDPTLILFSRRPRERYSTAPSISITASCLGCDGTKCRARAEIQSSRNAGGTVIAETIRC